MPNEYDTTQTGSESFAGKETARRAENSMAALTKAVRDAIQAGASSESLLAAYRKGQGKEDNTPGLPENVADAVSAALANGHSKDDVMLQGIRPALEALLAQTPQASGRLRSGWLGDPTERSPHSADPKNSHGWGGRG